jgi:hypothetical protein
MSGSRESVRARLSAAVGGLVSIFFQDAVRHNLMPRAAMEPLEARILFGYFSGQTWTSSRCQRSRAKGALATRQRLARMPEGPVQLRRVLLGLLLWP